MHFTHALLATIVGTATVVHSMPVDQNPICDAGGAIATAFTALSRAGGGAGAAFCTSILNIRTFTDVILTPVTQTRTVVSYKNTVTFTNPTKTVTDIKHVTKCISTPTAHNNLEDRAVLSLLPSLGLPTPTVLSGLLDQQVTAVCRCLDLAIPTVTVTSPSAQHVEATKTLWFTKTHINGQPTTTQTLTTTATLNRCGHNQ